MNDIRPFRGLRFDESVTGSLGNMVCPPYDIISPEEQVQLYDRNPFNVVRLELGLEMPGDDGKNNRYTRAAETISRWMEGEVLRTDDDPALYLYRQEFEYQGRKLARLGVLAALRLSHWREGVVLPHEETMAGPKEDRLRLMRATTTNLSPLYLLFDDPTGSIRRLLAEIARQRPDAVADTGDGQTHRLWVIRGPRQAQLLAELRQPQLYMADGHHRYETALAYRDERRGEDGASGDGAEKGERSGAPYDFAMVLMVDARDPGLVVLPTHRLIHRVDPAVLAALEEGLSWDFQVEPVSLRGLNAQAGAEKLLERMREKGRGTVPVLGFYGGVPRRAELLVLRLPVEPSSGARPILDVDVLHHKILRPLLGIGADELKAGTHVTYTRDAAEALAAVDRGYAQAAFFLNPTRVEQVLQTARAHGKMPQKSTYFYPKPVTGLVMHRLA